jgi:hypothetical protein
MAQGPARVLGQDAAGKALAMMVRTDSYPGPDMSAFQRSRRSISVSSTDQPQTGVMPFWNVPRNAFFFVDYHQFGSRPTIIFLDQKTELSIWIEDAFAELTARLASPPDPDLIDVAQFVTFTKSAEITDDWIESIAENWARIRD